MSDPEQFDHGQEPINDQKVIDLIDFVRSLLPPGAPNVVTIPGFDPFICHKSSVAYTTSQGNLQLEETDGNGFHDLRIRILDEFVDEDGRLMRTRRGYGINFTNMTTNFYDRTEPVPDAQNTESSAEDILQHMFAEGFIKSRVDEITGDNIVTNERYQNLLILLQECRPDAIAQDS